MPGEQPQWEIRVNVRESECVYVCVSVYICVCVLVSLCLRGSVVHPSKALGLACSMSLSE